MSSLSTSTEKAANLAAFSVETKLEGGKQKREKQEDNFLTFLFRSER